MVDMEMLEAMRQMLHEELEPMKHDLAEVRQHVENIEQRTTKIEVTLENDIAKRLKSLGEGQEGMNEKFAKLDKVAEDVEEIKVKVTALEAVTKDNTAQIRNLRIVK